MFTTGMTQAQVLDSVKMKLKNIRDALAEIEKLYEWSSGVAATDLVTSFQFASNDANDILSAIADHNALAQIRKTGQPPSTYPQVSNPYNYSAAANRVMGP